MTDAEIAVERLMAWIRDFGDKKEPAFIGDLSMVLLLAKEHLRKPADEKQTLRRIASIVREAADHVSDDEIRNNTKEAASELLTLGEELS